MIKNATFVSVWDDGTEIESECKVNTDTLEVFDIEMVDVSEEDFDFCVREYIIIDDDDYPVDQKMYALDDEYWYE